MGNKARESFRVFEADRPGDFAQASNEEEEPSHGRILLKLLSYGVSLADEVIE
jgi:hypothetical protein